MAATSDKLPALPWYPRDFLADGPVALMTLEEEGAYRRLLDYQWLNDAIPSDIESLAAICKGIPASRMRTIWQKVGPLFHVLPDDPERAQNAKLERVRSEVLAHREKRRKAGRTGARSRWQTHSNRIADASESHSGDDAESVAKPWPASASASAKASNHSNNNNGAARAEPAASWPQLHAKLPPTGLYRQQVMAFVASLPETHAEGWCALLLQTLAGIGTPGGVAVTPDELLTTIATYTASRTGDHDTRYFAGCLRNVVKRRYAETRKAEGSAAEPGTLRLPRLTDPDMQAAS